MKRFLSLLLHPLLLSLWGTLPVIFLLPVKNNRYEFRNVEQGSYISDIIKRYADLDMDGSAETISTFQNSLGQAGLTIGDHKGYLNQWNFQGTFGFSQFNGFVVAADCNNDQIREVYAFTLKNDSVMVYIIPDYKKNDYTTRFVTRVGTRDGKSDPFVFGGQSEDLNGDGTGELIFGIGTGFSLQPRNIFAYDQVRDTILTSPHSGYFLNGLILEDIAGDGTKEIIPYGYAAGNIHDPAIPYPDSVSWLMVLDEQLRFVFKPVMYPQLFSKVAPFVIPQKDQQAKLGALYLPFDNIADKGVIYLFNNSGIKTSERILQGNPDDVLIVKDNHGNPGILVTIRNSGFDLYNDQLQLVKSVPLGGRRNLTLMDIDLDGNREIISADIQGRSISISRNDLSHTVTSTFRGDGEKGILYSLMEYKGQPPLLYMQFGNNYNVFSYSYNPWFWLRYSIFGGIYVAILLLTLISRKIQRDQIRKKQETEKKIIDLQLRLISNQLDPHFVMNCINTIMAGITMDEKEKAGKQLMHFSRLHRSLLLQSDRILITLQEEIDFLKDYLALQKYRYPDHFEYQLDIDPNINPDVLVPKMLLQIYSENALKHGILPLERIGLLQITVTMNEAVRIEIRDDGAGRNAREGNKESTGKGLALMEQYFDLLMKLNQTHIRQEIIDHYDRDNQPVGTSVVITIEYKED